MEKIIGRPVRFAVVGCGHIGRRHAEMIEREEGAELVALCDIRPRRVLKVSAFDVPFFPGLLDLLSGKVPMDAVCICTPNAHHAYMAVAALARGHHVIVEKPMALTSAEAERVVAASLRYGREVFCVMQNRYSPPAMWLHGLVKSGRLGRIFSVQVNCSWNRDGRYYTRGGWHGTCRLDGGTLFTQFSHFVDILYWVFGDICDIRARFSNFNHAGLTEFEDSGQVMFRFCSGGTGMLSYTTSVWDRNFESSLTVIAERGTVRIGGQYMNEVQACHVLDYRMPELPPTAPGNDYGAYTGSAQNHHLVIRNAVNVLSGKTSEPVATNMRDGLKVVDIIERIYACKRNEI
jgi:predicted dehydrogenase